MIAVVKTGGKQYIVKAGSRVRVEKVLGDQGEAVALDVLMTADEDGKTVSVGTPFIAGAAVTSKILSHGRSRKITMLKYKPKKRYRLRKGHRQHYTEMEITGIK